MKRRNYSLIALVALLFGGLLAPVDYSDAKPPRSSGSSYRPAPRPAPRPRPTPAPRPVPSKTAPKTPSKAGSSKAQGDTKKTTGSQRPASAADQARYQKAVKGGTAFKTRDAATADFKAKHASTYKSTYATKPTTRPAHIPETYRDSSGNTRQVSYDQSRGGYGSWSGGGPGLGTFLMYDMMSDAIMMNAMMSNQGYHYGGAPMMGSGHAVHHRTGVSPICMILGFLVVGGLIVGGFIYLKENS